MSSYGKDPCTCPQDCKVARHVPDADPHHRWSLETMRTINILTPEIKGKAFDPDWFLLRERLEQAEEKLAQFNIEWDGQKWVYNGRD